MVLSGMGGGAWLVATLWWQTSKLPAKLFVAGTDPTFGGTGHQYLWKILDFIVSHAMSHD